MATWWLVLELDGAGAPAAAFSVNEGTTTVGRGLGNDATLLDPRVSSRHLRLERRGDDVTVVNLSTSLGTTKDGIAIDVVALAPGEAVVAGGSTLRLLRDLPPPAPVRPFPGGTAVIDGDAEASWHHFRAFIEKLRRSGNSREMLEHLLAGLVDLLGAERGFVLLAPRPDAPLTVVAAHNLDDERERSAISRTVCRAALDAAGPLAVMDASADPRFAEAESLAVAEYPRAIVAAPLVVDGRSVGVVYVDMPKPRVAVAPAQLHLFSTVTSLAAELVAAARTRKRLLEAQGRIEVLSALAGEDDEFVFGDGPTSHRLHGLIEAAAAQDVTVLMTGETGTGKEMAARALHRLSDRRDGPFVPVHTAALPREMVEAELFGVEKGAFTGATETRKGRFELAAGGTLFLDEVGELPPESQVALLRVIQERQATRLGGTAPRPLDFRLVCATNADIESLVKQGLFRQDLYFRINVFRLELPPLRARPEAVLPLARHFLADMASRCGKAVRSFSPAAEAALRAHAWPGNVRELRNAVERAVVVETGSTVAAESLPIGLAPTVARVESDGRPAAEGSVPTFIAGLPDAYADALDAFDRAFFARMLAECDGSARAVARRTQIGRNTLVRKLKRAGLSD